MTYPRENFTVDSAQHGEIVLGVDTNGDGSVDRTLNETHVSGVTDTTIRKSLRVVADERVGEKWSVIALASTGGSIASTQSESLDRRVPEYHTDTPPFRIGRPE
ncbi:hypothetical protein [Natrinema ejinorense]|uniref:hypothetical protein n=1 Tax=Natrinema ejinorense TaxID=373386 RepID=UPI001FE62D37|nr:hypothetical protein [Natrinema ejinorense]